MIENAALIDVLLASKSFEEFQAAAKEKLLKDLEERHMRYTLEGRKPVGLEAKIAELRAL